MFRILEANFIVQVLPLLMIAAAVILVLKARKGGRGSSLKRYLGISLASVPAGILVYIFAGMEAAAMRDEGHFYSIPFGGYSASNDLAMGISILIWIGLVFAILAFVLRPRK